MTTEELRKSLGLKEGQLLTNAQGMKADILAVKDGQVLLGILHLAKPQWVPLKNILAKAP